MASSEKDVDNTTIKTPIMGRLGEEPLDLPDRPKPIKGVKDGMWRNPASGFVSNKASITGMPARDRKPIIPMEDTNEDILQRDLYKHGIVHDDLIYLSQITIPDTPANREFLFKKSDIAQVIVRMVQMTIVGDGIEPESDDQQVLDALREFFLNMRGPLDDYNVSDLVYDIVRDCVNHGYHVSALLSTKYTAFEDAFELDFDIEESLSKDKAPVDDKTEKQKALHIHRLDMRTIQKATHPTTGALKFIQEVVGPSDLPTNTRFMSKDYNPTFKTPYGLVTDVDQGKIYRINLTPDKVFYVNLFREPAISPVLDMIAHRTWLLWAQKKVGLKHAGDVPVVKVGTAEDHTEDLSTRLNELTEVSEFLADMRFGDAIALDYNMEWVPNKNVGGNAGFSFDKVIDNLDKRVALAIGSSMALFEASGAELASSRTIQDTFLRWIAGIRTKLERSMTILCYRYLAARGIPFKKGGFSIKWSPLRERMMGEVINAVRNMWDSGMIQTMQEGRSMTAGIFDLEYLEDSEDMSYMDIIYQKAYNDAKARMDVQIAGQKEMDKIEMAKMKKMVKDGLMPDPTPDTNDATSVNDGRGGAPKSGAGKARAAVRATEENTQGSTTGNLQPGDRKRGPQTDTGGATQTASERDEQNTGKL